MARLLPSTSWMRLRVDPPLTPAESLETTRIYSAMGLLKPGQPLTPVLGRPGFSGTPPDGRPATMRFASWGSDRGTSYFDHSVRYGASSQSLN